MSTLYTQIVCDLKLETIRQRIKGIYYILYNQYLHLRDLPVTGGEVDLPVVEGAHELLEAGGDHRGVAVLPQPSAL